MDLQPDTTDGATPGRWINRDWKQGSAGLFAVAIGVSNYRHLEGGEAEAEDTLALGQLTVSALTAYRVFDWLRTAYRDDDAPLAECWLLLSPTADEIKIEPEIATHQATPDLEACKEALQAWRTRLRKLPEPSARKSRALFFFSGHGLETQLSRQILLPADYLYPPGDNYDDAISPINLHRSLLANNVPSQFFFLDACRNDLPFLREQELRGQKLLPVPKSADANPDTIAPILHATAPGAEAFSPDDAESGDLSLFGQALVDGLHGTRPIEVTEDGPMPSINVYPLQQYMKAHIVRRIRAAKADIKQSIRLGGEAIDDLPITYLDPATVKEDDGETPVFRGGGEDGRSFSPPGEPPSLPDAPSVSDDLGDRRWRTRPTRDPEELMADEVNDSLEDRYEVTRRPAADLNALRQDFDLGHDAFGSERITEIWTQQTSIFALGKGEWIDSGRLIVQRVDRDLRRTWQRVFLTIKDDDVVGHWLQLDDRTGRYFGCVLPTERGRTVNFILEMRYAYREELDELRLAVVESYLAANNSSSLGEVASIMHHERVAHLGGSIASFQESDIRKTLREPTQRGRSDDASPLAAALIAGLLLRANKLDELEHESSKHEGGWLNDFADQYRPLPDIAALRAHELARRRATRGDTSAVEACLTALDREGLPVTTEAMNAASGQVQRLIDQEGNASANLYQLGAALERALVHLQENSTFTVYAHLPALGDPRELIGPWF